jgi:hypothetical protein
MKQILHMPERDDLVINQYRDQLFDELPNISSDQNLAPLSTNSEPF